MDVTGLASALAYNKTATDYGTAMLSKSLDAMEAEGAGLVKLMQTAGEMDARALQAAATGTGQNLDVSV